MLYERGELPRAFAVPGGWGDVIVATLLTHLVIALGGLRARRPDAGVC